MTSVWTVPAVLAALTVGGLLLLLLTDNPTLQALASSAVCLPLIATIAKLVARA